MVCSHPVLDALGHNTSYFCSYAQIPCSNLPMRRRAIPLPLRSILCPQVWNQVSPSIVFVGFLPACWEVMIPYIISCDDPQLTPMSLLVLYNFVCPRRARVVRAPWMLTSAFPLSFFQDSPETCCNGGRMVSSTSSGLGE